MVDRVALHGPPQLELSRGDGSEYLAFDQAQVSRRRWRIKNDAEVLQGQRRKSNTSYAVGERYCFAYVLPLARCELLQAQVLRRQILFAVGEEVEFDGTDTLRVAKIDRPPWLRLSRIRRLGV